MTNDSRSKGYTDIGTILTIIFFTIILFVVFMFFYDIERSGLPLDCFIRPPQKAADLGYDCGSQK